MNHRGHGDAWLVRVGVDKTRPVREFVGATPKRDACPRYFGNRTLVRKTQVRPRTATTPADALHGFRLTKKWTSAWPALKNRTGPASPGALSVPDASKI
jgi:hypothetical protein